MLVTVAFRDGTTQEIPDAVSVGKLHDMSGKPTAYVVHCANRVRQEFPVPGVLSMRYADTDTDEPGPEAEDG